MSLPDANAVMDSLLYACPLCNATVEIPHRMFGKTVDCPKCHGPFVVEPPKAHPLDPSVKPDSSEIAKVTEIADDEWTDMTVHPVVLRRHFIGVVICSLMFIAGTGTAIAALFGMKIAGFGGVGLVILALIVALIALTMLGRWWLLSWMQCLTITNERLVYTYGLIHRGTSEVRHADIRNLKVTQNVVERLLSYGDIAVSSAGQDDMEIVMNDIPDPEHVAELIRKRQQ